jgi:hypothetical protein
MILSGYGSRDGVGAGMLALEIFLLFYVTCIALTWWYYIRKTTILGKARVKQTFAPQYSMSALPPTTTAKADFRTRSCLLIRGVKRDVRFGP